MRGSLRLRLLAGAAVWICLALVAAGLAISWLLRDQLERSFDTRLESVAIGMLAELQTDPQTGAIVLSRTPVEANFNRVASGWYWQISDADGPRLRSRSLWNEALATGGPNEPGGRQAIPLPGPHGGPLRALVLDVTAPGGGGPLRVAVAGPQAAISGEAARLERTLFAALFVLGLGLAAAVWLQTVVALRPLGSLRERLAEVRTGRREELNVEGFSEMRPLVAELNALLSENRAVVERARTHAANLAHGLKTPLSALVAEAGRPGRDPEGSLAETAAAMERQISHHLRRARRAGATGIRGERVPVEGVAADLLLALSRIHAERGIRPVVEIEPALAFHGERQDLEEMLGNLLDNAFKWAARHVRLTARSEGQMLVITVSDDGPGLPPAALDHAMQRGRRLDERVPGDGFGLAITDDLATLYGGSLTLEPAAGSGGLAAILVLPAAIQP